MSNVTKLAIHLASLKAVPPDTTDGLAAGIDWLRDQERMKADMKSSFDEAHVYINAVKQSRNNHYGDDDEAIAGAILDAFERKQQEKKSASEEGAG